MMLVYKKSVADEIDVSPPTAAIIFLMQKATTRYLVHVCPPSGLPQYFQFFSPEFSLGKYNFSRIIAIFFTEFSLSLDVSDHIFPGFL